MIPQAYPDPAAGVGAGPGAGPGPALFTPGLDKGQMQPPYYGQDPSAGVGYGQPQPGYGQQPQAYGQPQVNQMVDQFATMGMGGQKGVSVFFTVYVAVGLTVGWLGSMDFTRLILLGRLSTRKS